MDVTLARSRPISGLASLWRSTIGKKYVMAITGLIWFGYLILHLWGNLKIYAGPQFLNEYGGFLCPPPAAGLALLAVPSVAPCRPIPALSASPCAAVHPSAT